MPNRPYQSAALDAMRLASIQGCNRQLIVLPTACHAKGQPILMYSGEIRAVEDIVVGDQLMGPDSTPRNVLELHRGIGEMARIKPHRGYEFDVTLDHKLTLVRTNDGEGGGGGEILDISVREYIGKTKWFKHLHKLFHVGVDFPSSTFNAPIEPYFLGLILGDGCISNGGFGICTIDTEIVTATHFFAARHGYEVRADIYDGKAPVYYFTRHGKGDRTGNIHQRLKSLGLWKASTDNKFIPFEYLTASRQDRLELLAGLIDTDGQNSTSGGFDFISKSDRLAYGVSFLALSLGFWATVSPCMKHCQTGGGGIYYRVYISGDLRQVPCMVPRKRVTSNDRRTDPLRTGFTVSRIPDAEYFGFAIDGDHRYLLADFTVTHNSGKTHLFSQVPATMRMRRPDKMVVLCQSDEIAFQSARKLTAENPALRVGMEKAEFTSRPDDDIIVASIPTIGGTKMGEDGQWIWGKRLARLDRDAIRYVIVDETHHITAPQYHGPLRYFGVMKNDPQHNDPNKFLLGVTATPNRSDNKGLEDFYDRIVYNRDIRSMISEGWLAPIEAHRVDTMVDISKVTVRAGEFVKSELEETINTPERNNLIVDKYLEIGESAPFLAFTVDIQHTVDLTDCFRARGIECYGIASKSKVSSPWLITADNERKQAIEKFTNGEFRGLLSCAALLEGFDAPRAMVGLDGAPTKSTLRFTQKAGRILRPFPAPEAAAAWNGWRKRAAIWIDFVDGTAGRHSLMTAPSLLGLKSTFDAKGKDLLKVVEEIERMKAEKPAINMALYDSLDAIKGVAERIDLFAVPTVDPEVAQYSKLSWVTGITNGSFQLLLPDKGMLSVKVNALGEYEVSKHLTGIRKIIGITHNLKDALSLADKNVPAEAMIVLKSDAGWRALGCSDAQCGALARLYPDMRRSFPSYQDFCTMVRNTYNKGQVSSLISNAMAKQGPQRSSRR